MERMTRLRSVVREHNIYRWAANLIAAVSEIRVELPAEGAKGQPA